MRARRPFGQHGHVEPAPARPVRPIGFAHRGARSERPENTLEAFARALELGANGLESDAWITADGHVALDHDGVIGRPWRRRPIASLAQADLPPHIPSLADLYGQLGVTFELSLDVKDPAAMEAILDTARQAGATQRLWLCHGDWQLLAQWRPAAGEARLVESTSMARMAHRFEELARRWHTAGIDAVNLHRREWTAAAVATTHQAGLRAFGWDAQSRADISRLLDFGIDAVYSDHVDRLVAAIESRPR
jgi:glycerophosphoryl diester phosphodiesterase